MVPDPSTTTRRTLLAGVGTAVAGALAGCSASESHSSPPEGGTLVTDYAVVTTRSTGERPPVVAPREDDGGDETATTPDPLSLHAVESQSGAASFEFADDATNGAAVRRLLAETDYANESVLVYQTRIRECYRLKLDYVVRDDDGEPSVEFCRVIRDAHTACERRAFDTVASFVRLPFPGESYNGYSAGGGSSCGRIPERYRNASESTNGSESP